MNARQAKTGSAVVRLSPPLSLVLVKHDAVTGGSAAHRADPDEQLIPVGLTGSGHLEEKPR